MAVQPATSYGTSFDDPIYLGQSREERAARMDAALRRLVRRLAKASPFYQRKLKAIGLDPRELTGAADLARLPFTTKEELRETYPLGLQAVPDAEVVRVHSSSGTTGLPVIIPYTRRDVETWSLMMARCYAMAGVTPLDRVQVTPGYGLWTAGIGFQLGAELLGAMVVPMGPGNTEKQLQMMQDLRSTVLTGTSSYALLLAEEINRRGLRDRLHLRCGIFGSERWGEKMRRRIEGELGVESFDIYGLTEVYGPGIGLDCRYHRGIHYWVDHLFFEIVDPVTSRPLPPGDVGELAVTTLTKEGAPLLRYRTRDLSRLIPGDCPCGSVYPRIDRILGRADDMVKIKGVNIYPGQVDELLHGVPGASSEYQIVLAREDGRDEMRLQVEIEAGADPAAIGERIARGLKGVLGLTATVETVPLGALPRSEKKTRRVIDRRDLS